MGDESMISEQINILKTEMALATEVIKESNEEGFNEYGPLLEAFALHAMEEITGEQFTNLNRLNFNSKAIDLVNDKGTIVVQVTSTADAAKIRETISKFEEKDSVTGLSIKDDYPGLKQLLIFGFCSASDASKFKNPIPPYCKVVSRKYFYQELRGKLDMDSVLRVRDKVRNVAFFDKLHPIRDSHCIRIMLQHIDRGAVKHPIDAEGCYAEMTGSLKDLKKFIDTGKNSSGKTVCKPRSEFNDHRYVDYLDAVQDNISKILQVCNLVKNTRGDPIYFREEEKIEIDRYKRQIALLTTNLNKIVL